MSDQSDRFDLLRSMAEASPLAMAVSEGPSHVLRYVNPAFCRLYGRSPGELLGRPFADACPDEELAAARTLLDRVFETGAAEISADLSRAGPDRDTAFWSYAAWPLLDHEGVFTQVTDTTERHQAAEARQGELQAANQQLLLAALREDERSEKLLIADRAKDDFLAMLAHELRNPLAPVLFANEILARRVAGDPSLERQCALIDRQVRHMGRLLDDLLEASRLTRGVITLRRAPTDFAALVGTAVTAAGAVFELRRQEVSYVEPPEPLCVDGDATRLEQVVTNILSNASKYTEPGGKIRITLQAEPDEAVLRVADTGIGIAPELLPRIFDLFTQGERSLDRSQGGLGIGLTLVRSLVTLHGGTVEARSEGPGRGSELTVRLPLLKDVTPPPPAKTLAPANETRRNTGPLAVSRPLVLVVDDNRDGADTLVELGTDWGYEMRAVYDGLSAVDAARELSPRIIVMDIGLPGIDGYEAARRIRGEPALAGVRLVAFTGYGSREDRQRTRDAGFDYHLIKPVDPEELERLLGDLSRAPAP